MIRCDLRDHLGAQLFFVGSYSQREIRLLKSHFNEGEVFVDIGANLGLFTIELARQAGPKGRVLAFEPASDTVEQMRSNIVANGVDTIVDIFHMALGEEHRELPLRSMADDPDDMARRSLEGTGQTLEVVSIEVFDDLVASGRIQLPTGFQVLKIDVEGAEASVLKGMRESLSKFRPRFILMETAEHNLARFGSSVAEIDNLLGVLGYVRAGVSDESNTAYVPG